MPPAKLPTIRDTGIRVPRTTGLPWHTFGSITIRSFIPLESRYGPGCSLANPEGGQQRRFFIPCPHCEHPIKLLWPQVKWDPQAKDESGAWHLGRVRASAHYQCQECAGHISDAQKVVAVRKGLWRPENPNAIPGVRSYHLSREEIREAQIAHGVTDNHVGIDSGHAAADVYAHCLRWGRIVSSRQPGLLPIHVGWTPMKGRERDASWKDPKTKQPRPYCLGSAALPHRKFRLPLLEFNGDFLLDILAKLRKGPEGAGGFRWELTGQADEEYFRHLDAKVKKPEVIGRSGKVQVIWRLRSGRWPDHLLDCELEQLAMAMIHRRLPWATIAQPEKEEETA